MLTGGAMQRTVGVLQLLLLYVYMTTAQPESVYSGCVKWRSNAGTFSSNGLNVLQYKTLADCQAQCASNIQCIAIDYDNSASPCWFHTEYSDLTAENTYTRGDVTQFIIDRLCAPPVCKSWTSNDGTFSIDGDLFTRYNNSLTDCLAYCESVEACVAIDFQYLDNESACWVHTNPDDLITHYPGQDRTQFVISKTCSNNGCIRWRSYKDQNSVGAMAYPQYKTVSDCLAYCASNSRCVAVDYNTNDNECWVHFLASDLTEIFNLGGVTQYIITRSCNEQACQKWGTYPTQSSSGGTLVPSVLSVSDCQTYCERNVPGCVAVDYDGSCWIHNKSSDLLPQNTMRRIGVLQFQLSTCVLSSCGQWSVYYTQNSLNGIHFPRYKTLTDCLAFCLSNTRCVAVDFDSTSEPCWIHTDYLDLTWELIYNVPGVSQFQLSRACGSYGCPQWLNFTNQNSQFATEFRSLRSVSDCLQACADNVECLAVDYDTNVVSDTNKSTCWMHFNAADLTVENTFALPGIVQYKINRTCTFSPTKPTISPLSTRTKSQNTPAPSTPSGPTRVSPGSTTTNPGGGECPLWTVYEAQYSDGATRQDGINTIEACLDFCLASSTCLAVDFSTAYNECWIHTNSDDLTTDNTYFDDKEATQYIKNNCTGYVASSSTSTLSGSTSTTSEASTSLSSLFSTTSGSTSTAFQESTLTAIGGVSSSGSTTPEGGGGESSSTTTPSGGEGGSSTSTVSPSPPNEDCVWSSPLTDTNAAGSQPRRELTVSDCQLACVSTIYCIGIDVDWNVGHTFCWLTVLPSASRLLTTADNVDHYRLTRNIGCLYYGEILTTTPTIPTGPSTINPPAPACYVQKILNANADAGQLIGRRTLEQCLALCLATYPQCVAIDYRTSDGVCYTQPTVRGRQWNSCCVRYELTCGAASPCSDTLAWYRGLAPANVPSSDRRYVSTDGSAAPCQTACLQDSLCGAVTWTGNVTVALRCVLYSGNFSAVSSSSNTELYVRQRCEQMPTTTPPATTTAANTPPPGYCVLDIVWVVDLSGSVVKDEAPGVNNFQLLKTFLASVIQPPLHVGLNFDRIGLVTFSSMARAVFDLTQRPSAEQIVAALDSIPEPYGTTNTPDGILLGYQMLTGATMGARPNAKKVMLLLHDGPITAIYQPNYLPAIAVLNQTNMLRVGIGLLGDVNQDDLKAFVVSPTRGTFGVIDSFQELGTLAGEVVNAMASECLRVSADYIRASIIPESLNPTTPEPAIASNCRKLDLTFVVDSSGSIDYLNPGNWAHILSFCNRVISRLSVGPDTAQVALVSFADSAAVGFRLADHPTAAALQTAVNATPHDGAGGTNLRDALALLASDVYAAGGGSRVGSIRVAVILTDGDDNVPTTGSPETIRNADRCKHESGIRLVALGISHLANAARLLQIVSSVDDFYAVPDFKDLEESLVESLLERIACPDGLN